MNHFEFYAEETVNGVAELDFLNSTLGSIVLRYQTGTYQVTQEDIQRPDLISYKVYGDESWWWLLCLVNGIFNPLEDFQVGMVLSVPNLLDLYNARKELAQP